MEVKRMVTQGAGNALTSTRDMLLCRRGAEAALALPYHHTTLSRRAAPVPRFPRVHVTHAPHPDVTFLPIPTRVRMMHTLRPDYFTPTLSLRRTNLTLQRRSAAGRGVGRRLGYPLEK